MAWTKRALKDTYAWAAGVQGAARTGAPEPQAREEPQARTQGHGSHWPTHSTHQEVKLACQAQHLRGRKSACKRGVGKGLTDAYRRRWRVAAVCSGVGYFMASGKCSLRGAEGEAVCSMPEGWEGHLAGLASRISCSHMWPLHMHDVGRPEHVRPQRCKPTRPPCSTPRSTW